MIYHVVPENFKPKFSVVACYVEQAGELLFLHRQSHKAEGDTWGLPAGKIDNSESPLEAMVREVREETGLQIAPDKFEHLNEVYVRYPEYDFVYHMFKTNLEERPEIVLSASEHKASKWLTPLAALEIALVPDLDECLKMSYSF